MIGVGPPQGQDQDPVLALPVEEGPVQPFSLKAVTGDHDTPSAEQDLRDAAEEGNLDMLKQLINSKAVNINAVHPKTGKTALHYAIGASKNQLEMIKLLVEAGIDVGIKDKDGKTGFNLVAERHENDHDDNETAGWTFRGTMLLMEAATGQIDKEFAKEEKDRDWKKIAALVDEAGGDMSKHRKGFPLDKVGYFKDPEAIFKDLLTNGKLDLAEAKVGNQSAYDYFRYTDNFWGEKHKPPGSKHFPKIADLIQKEGGKQLQDAFKAGDWARAVKLIKNTKPDPAVDYQHSERKISLLSYAAKMGQLDVVKALVESVPEGKRKDFINAKGETDQTALHYAASARKTQVYDYLVSQGGDENAKMSSGGNPTPKTILAGGGSSTQTGFTKAGRVDLKNPPKDPVAHAEWLEAAMVQVYGEKFTFDRNDLKNNPDKYSNEERAFAIMELELAQNLLRVGDGTEVSRWIETAGNLQWGTDPNVIIKELQKQIDKIGGGKDEKKAEEIAKAYSKISSEMGAALYKSNPELRKTSEEALDKFRKGEGFDEMVDRLTTDKKDPNKVAAAVEMALAMYGEKMQLVNGALGADGQPFMPGVMANIQKSKHWDQIETFIKNDFENPNRLKDLVDGKVPGLEDLKGKPEAAAQYLAYKMSVYSNYVDSMQLQGHYNDMVKDFGIDAISNEALAEIVDADGNIDDKKLEQFFEELKKQNPNLKNVNPTLLVAEFKAMWDTAKAAGYADLGKWIRDLIHFERLSYGGHVRTIGGQIMPVDENGRPRVVIDVNTGERKLLTLSPERQEAIRKLQAGGAAGKLGFEGNQTMRQWFRNGTFQAVSGGFAALGLVLYGATGKGDSWQNITAMAASGALMIDAGIQTWERLARLGPQAGGFKIPVGANEHLDKVVTNRWKSYGWSNMGDTLIKYDNIRNFSKLGLGGPAVGIFSALLAVDGTARLKNGDPAGAGLAFTAAGANGLLAALTIGDAVAQLSPWAKSKIQNIFSGGKIPVSGGSYASLGFKIIRSVAFLGSKVLGPFAIIADLALFFYDLFKSLGEGEKASDWAATWGAILRDYGMKGHETKPSDPDDPNSPETEVPTKEWVQNAVKVATEAAMAQARGPNNQIDPVRYQKALDQLMSVKTGGKTLWEWMDYYDLGG